MSFTSALYGNTVAARSGRVSNCRTVCYRRSCRGYIIGSLAAVGRNERAPPPLGLRVQVQAKTEHDGDAARVVELRVHRRGLVRRGRRGCGGGVHRQLHDHPQVRHEGLRPRHLRQRHLRLRRRLAGARLFALRRQNKVSFRSISILIP